MDSRIINMKEHLKRILHYKGSIIEQWRIKKQHDKIFDKKSRTLKQHGNYMLDAVFEVANNFGIQAWIEFGTLLGALRENAFIKHDFDLDIGMYKKDYSLEFENALYEKGFIKIRSFYIYSVDKKSETMTEVTFDYEGLQLDIFFNQEETNCRSAYYYESYDKVNSEKHIYSVVKLKYPYVKGLSMLTINQKEYPSPQNAKEILEAYYGKDYMTPIKDYIIPDDDPCTEKLSFDKYHGLMKGVWNLSKSK